LGEGILLAEGNGFVGFLIESQDRLRLWGCKDVHLIGLLSNFVIALDFLVIIALMLKIGDHKGLIRAIENQVF
jgi:hypothetical protein